MNEIIVYASPAILFKTRILEKPIRITCRAWCNIICIYKNNENELKKYDLLDGRKRCKKLDAEEETNENCHDKPYYKRILERNVFFGHCVVLQSVY